jgi:hypothetical protein
VPPIGVSLFLAFAMTQQPLDGWHLLTSGPPADGILNCLGRIITPFYVGSTRQGVVFVSDGGPPADLEPLPVSPADLGLPQDSDRHWIATKQGWLVGFNAGEFGGGCGSCARMATVTGFPWRGFRRGQRTCTESSRSPPAHLSSWAWPTSRLITAPSCGAFGAKGDGQPGSSRVLTPRPARRRGC